MSDEQTPAVDPRTTVAYWQELCRRLYEENERLKERLRVFLGD